MGMFGPLTRSVKNFYPTRLLCKRFNVKPPAHVQLDPGNGSRPSAVVPVTSSSRFQSAGYQMQPSGDVEKGGPKVADQKLLESSGYVTFKSSTSTLPAASAMTIDLGRNDALEVERPSDEVFKAIFGSEDEDD
jgi:G patch domain-containing protein 1